MSVSLFTEMKFYLCDGHDERYIVHNALDLKFIAAIDTNSFTLCCNNTTEHKHNTLLTTSFTPVVSPETVRILSQILNGELPTFYKDGVYQVDIAKDILDYCFATEEHIRQFYNVCNGLVEESSSIIEEPRTLFGLFKVLQTTVTTDTELINNIMNNDQIFFTDRLLFASFHADTVSQFDKINTTHNKVSQTLGISKQMLNFLQPNRVIVAGGSVVKLFCPWSKFQLSSDIDIFILSSVKNTERDIILYDMCEVLKKSGRLICFSGKSVITAVGTYGQRRVQIIISPAISTYDLLQRFDMNLLKSAYDGKQLTRLCSAHYDHATHKCSNGKFSSILPIRLAKVAIKGFMLNAAAIKYLKYSLGWPLSPRTVDRIKYDIPYIAPNIPKKVQEQHLLHYDLTLIPECHEIKIFNDLVPLNNAYGGIHCGTAIFTGTLDEYIPTVTLADPSSVATDNVYMLHSEYAIKLPICTVPYDAYTEVESQYTVWQHMTILNENDRQMFSDWTNAISENILKHHFPHMRFAPTPLVYYIHIAQSPNCVWLHNGIRLMEKPQFIRKSTHIQANGTADALFYNYGSPGMAGIRFNLHRIAMVTM